MPKPSLSECQDELLTTLSYSFASGAYKALVENQERKIGSPVGVKDRVFFRHLFPGEPLPKPKRLQIDFRAEKWILAVTGCNGAGKTTLTRELLRNVSRQNRVTLNADKETAFLRHVYAGGPREDYSLMAVRKIDAAFSKAIDQNRSVLIETLISTDKYHKDVLRAKKRGYKLGLIYVSLEPPELSPARVAVRVLKNGHDVPHDKALSRYEASHKEAMWYAQQADMFIAFDNTNFPVVVAEKPLGGKLTHCEPNLNTRLDGIVYALSAPHP